MTVGGALLMGSKYGLMISLISVFLVVTRMIGEEKMLVNELEGYEEYKQKVSYGLIPLCLVTNGPLPWLARQAVR